MKKCGVDPTKTICAAFEPMFDLHALANAKGWGTAHKRLSREGHPTEFPRSAGLIDYRIKMQGPMGDQTEIEVQAESVKEAIRSARSWTFSAELLSVTPSIHNYEDIKILRVCAYD